MNTFCRLFFLLAIINTLFFSAACASGAGPKPLTDSIPPETWKEHWYQHDLLLTRVYVDEHVAVYYDSGVERSITWPFKLFSDSWAYIKKNYGTMGPERLYVVLHKGTLGGGHPSRYFEASHDYRNTIDCGLNSWNGQDPQQILMPIHEMGHLVNSVSHGTKGSPSDVIWRDSKFMEIFNYDVLMHIGREQEAENFKNLMLVQADDFPRKGTFWFRDWFFPIYQKYGKEALLNKYFALLSAHFPKDSTNRFTRNLNWGEFVHFWSAATGVNLKETAEAAFGWSNEKSKELKNARKEFPELKY